MIVGVIEGEGVRTQEVELELKLGVKEIWGPDVVSTMRC